MDNEAYSIGCDDRNDDKDLSDNPYDKTTQRTEWDDWRDGWLVTDANFEPDEEGTD